MSLEMKLMISMTVSCYPLDLQYSFQPPSSLPWAFAMALIPLSHDLLNDGRGPSISLERDA